MSTDKPTAEPPEDSTYPELMPVDELGRRPIKWDGNLASIKGFMAAVNEWRQENGILDTFFSHQAVDAGRGKLAIASLDSIHFFDTAGDWAEPPTPAKAKAAAALTVALGTTTAITEMPDDLKDVYIVAPHIVREKGPKVLRKILFYVFGGFDTNDPPMFPEEMGILPMFSR